MAGAGLAMLRGIQHAHYERGLKVVEPEVLGAIAGELGLDRASFEAKRKAAAVDQHIASTRQMMQQIGAGGFPAFVLEISEQWFAVPHQRFASDPAGFANWLRQSLHPRAAHDGSGAGGDCRR